MSSSKMRRPGSKMESRKLDRFLNRKSGERQFGAEKQPKILKIKTIIHDALNKNSIRFMIEFAALRSNTRRVEAMCQYLDNNEIAFSKLPPPSKSARKSFYYKAEGDHYFRAMDLKKAIRFYNRAVAYAPNVSKELSAAYASRSNVLFSLKRYDLSLLDVLRAMNCETDHNQLLKLNKKRLACESMPMICKPKPKDKDHEHLFILPSQNNPKIPCASGDITTACIRTYGHSIVAKNDIAPGSVLSCEKPFASVLMKEYHYVRCSNCCRHLDSLIPCDTCPHVMFCTAECKNQAWDSFHKYECPILHLLILMGFDDSDLIGLRAVLLARSRHSSWMELAYKSNNAIEDVDAAATGFDTSSPSDHRRIYSSKLYASLHSLDANKIMIETQINLQKATSIAILLQMLKHHTNLFEDPPEYEGTYGFGSTAENMYIAGGMCLHNIIRTSMNMHYINAVQEDKDGDYLETSDFAIGLYAFYGALNHSCSPNAHRVFVGTTSILMALRPIATDQQITVSYGPNYALHPLDSRQCELNINLFNCICEACLQNWPVYESLKSVESSKSKKGKTSHSILNKTALTVKLVKGEIKESLLLLDEMYKQVCFLEKRLPCKEHADYQKYIKQIWSLMGNVISYKDKVM